MTPAVGHTPKKAGKTSHSASGPAASR